MTSQLDKILYLQWSFSLIGAIALTFIYGTDLSEEFNGLYPNLMALFLLSYLPYTLLKNFLPYKWKKRFLFLNMCAFSTTLTFLLPYDIYFIFFFMPLISILFKSRFYVYTASIFTVISLIILSTIKGQDIVITIIELTLFVCFFILLVFVSRLSSSILQTDFLNKKMIYALIFAIEGKDPYTKGHSIRVAEYAVIIGKQMMQKGYDLNLSELKIIALIHDIGKMYTPYEILVKEGKLTDEEYSTIKEHSENGAVLADRLGYPKHFVTNIRHHHERYDGRGYPQRLAGKEIPLMSRIIALADTYDALTSNRTYRRAFTPDEARRIIMENFGSQFDPLLEPIFEEVYPLFVEKQEEMASNPSLDDQLEDVS